MENTWVNCPCLVVLIYELASTQGLSQGWISVPGTVWACAGENVSLPWKYNETIGVPNVVNVAWSVTLVTKKGSDDARSHQPRASFLPNAGVTISNVTANDSGKYESTVVFSDQHSLVDEATLVVYKACPDRQEFTQINIFIMRFIPKNITDINIQKPLKHFPVHFKVRVPEADPKVNCTLYVGDRLYDCESGEATVESEDTSNIIIFARLFHPALGESNRSMIYTNEDIISSVSTVIIEQDTTIVPGSNESLKAGGGSDLMAPVVVFGLLAFVLWPALLVVLFICYRKNKQKKNASTDDVGWTDRCRQCFGYPVQDRKDDVTSQPEQCVTDVGHEARIACPPDNVTAKSTISQPIDESSIPFIVDKSRLSQEETTLPEAECDLKPLNVIDDESTPRIEPQQSESPFKDKHGETPSEPMSVKNQKTRTNWFQGGPVLHPV